jgi:hypothetical protein
VSDSERWDWSYVEAEAAYCIRMGDVKSRSVEGSHGSRAYWWPRYERDLADLAEARLFLARARRGK